MEVSDKQFSSDKLFSHLDRLAQWQAGDLPAPITVELDLTNDCNHGCPGCSFSYLVNIVKESIDYELARDVIAELAGIGVRAITFSGGGEPLIYGEDRVLELMRLCRECGMETALITNGSKITKPDFLDLCSWVRISLDGYDAATFERFHGRSEREFEACVEATRFLCCESLTRKQLGDECATVGVGFLTDLDSVERDDFLQMAAFCAGIEGLDYLQFRPLVTNMVDDTTLTGGYEGFTQTALNQLSFKYHEARELYATESYRVLWSSGKYAALAENGFGRNYNRCLAHFTQATISANSKVYICCHTQGQERFCLGDLKQNTFTEVWHSEQAKQVYKTVAPHDECPPACRLHLQNNVLSGMAREIPHANFI